MRAGAFSLMELLVALGVAAAALIVVGGVIDASMKARTAAVLVGDELDRVMPVRGAMARLLGEANAAARRSDAPNVALFDGDARHARWVTQSWGGALPAGLYDVEATVSGAGGSDRLYLRLSRFDASRSPNTAEGATETAILPAPVSFAYAMREANGALRWRDAWRGNDGWPLAVAFTSGPGATLIVSLAQPAAAP